jgi:hypothetical protein
VAAALGLRDTRAATWAEGIEAAHRTAVFVTPPLGQWTLAVSTSLFPPDRTELFVKPLVELLSPRFEEAQYFCTHRDYELHIWARARKGRLLRGFGWLGQKSLTLWNEGVQSTEERDLGLRSFDNRSPQVEQAISQQPTSPDEACLMQLASYWSIDPTSLNEQFEQPEMGLLGASPVREKTSEAFFAPR